MKYLIIAALVSIIFVLVYSRVRPYLEADSEDRAVVERRHERQQLHRVSKRRHRGTSWFVAIGAGLDSGRTRDES